MAWVNGVSQQSLPTLSNAPLARAFYVLRKSISSMIPIILQFHFDGNLIAGDNFDIHDNNSVTINRSPQPTATSDTCIEDVTPIPPGYEEMPLFKYIHPSVLSVTARQQVHAEVQNLVRQFAMPDICRYLRQMRRENRVYLNVKPEAMFAELHRMGMPPETTPGFSYKNFMNYFNIND